VVVTKNKKGLLKIQGDTNKLKPGYKVKITGHVKGIGDKATMEGNTSEQLSEDLVTILPKGNSPRKVSVVGCGSGKCDENNNSFASNLEKNLQKKDVITTVKGYSKDISMSVKGKVLQGEQASADKRMMEEGGTTDTLSGELPSGRIVTRSSESCSEVLPSMVALSPIPLIWPVTGDTEQVSDEERKRLDKKKQQEETTTKEQEKFDKE
jgi:hypothetical protein